MFRTFLLTFLLSLSGRGTAQEMLFFTVGSGNVFGGYYAAASAICADINSEYPGELRCSPEPTSGSLYNLQMLKDGELDLAFTQSDWQRQAFEGVGLFAGEAGFPELRSIMSLYAETVTILARPDSGISGPADLPGHRIDIGPPASGRRATLLQLLDQLGISKDEFAGTYEFSTDLAIDELCAGRIDATVLIVGHPDQNVARALSQCDARIVPFYGPRINRAMQENGDFIPSTITSGTYPGQELPVRSYAVLATVVAREDTDPIIVGAFVRSAMKIARQGLTTGGIITHHTTDAAQDGLVAPMHPAATAAFVKASVPD